MTATVWSPPPVGVRRTATITPRQADVLTGVVLGLSNEQIGRRLHLTLDTVKTHVRALLKALQCRNRQQVVVLACTPGALHVEVSAYRQRESASLTSADLVDEL